jgi:glycosyltransferase involved in cell wall biosynthesis
MSRPALVVIGPIPPPANGVAISTSLVVANPHLAERFDVTHLDTSDRRSLTTMGSWDLRNMGLAMWHVGALGRLLRRREPGVVYLPISQSSGGFLRDALFILLARARGRRVAVHLRGSEFQRLYLGLSWQWRWLIRFALARVDSAAVMGATLRGELAGFVPARRIAVIPNGTPDEWPDAQAGGRDRMVLFMSNLLTRKGVEAAFEAATRVLTEEPEVRFVFAGSWQVDDLRRRLVAEAAAYPGIEFRESVAGAERRDLLGRAGVFLFPPVEPEGHPRVVIEALAAGVPLVTTDRGAIRESVTDGVEGFVLAEPDPAQIAERLLRLLRDEDLRTRMGAAARERYRSEFTQERADRLLADWLEELAP